jgi:hypothetical protein
MALRTPLTTKMLAVEISKQSSKQANGHIASAVIPQYIHQLSCTFFFDLFAVSSKSAYQDPVHLFRPYIQSHIQSLIITPFRRIPQSPLSVTDITWPRSGQGPSSHPPCISHSISPLPISHPDNSSTMQGIVSSPVLPPLSQRKLNKNRRVSRSRQVGEYPTWKHTSDSGSRSTDKGGRLSSNRPLRGSATHNRVSTEKG